MDNPPIFNIKAVVKVYADNLTNRRLNRVGKTYYLYYVAKNPEKPQ
jgi:hypothetical protein